MAVEVTTVPKLGAFAPRLHRRRGRNPNQGDRGDRLTKNGSDASDDSGILERVQAETDRSVCWDGFSNDGSEETRPTVSVIFTGSQFTGWNVPES